MTQNKNLADLSEAGVSVWLDDLSRDRISSGNLQELIDSKSVVGVTTNPSIFQAALSILQGCVRVICGGLRRQGFCYCSTSLRS